MCGVSMNRNSNTCFKAGSEQLYFHIEFADNGTQTDNSPAELDLLNTPIKTDKHIWKYLLDAVLHS